jgi:iron uptake system component EfeO
MRAQGRPLRIPRLVSCDRPRLTNRAVVALRPPGPALGVTAAALAVALLSGCGGGGVTANEVSVTTGACGTSWQHPVPGLQTFRIRNSSTAAADVDLINPATGAIYAEVESVGPGTTRPMQVNLGSGSYAFRCLVEDTDAVTGPVHRIAGHVRGMAGILPVTANDLIGPVHRYQAYVSAGLSILVRQVGALVARVKAGDLRAARAAWLPAHLTYERLGAAYGTFGAYDTEIDGRPVEVPGGIHDPSFTGFYRLEYGLWHHQSAARLAGPAERLGHDVRALQKAFPTMEIPYADLGLRTHEILENALQFQLTGHDDFGSGTTLATTAANIEATRELLRILHPLLVARYQSLPAVYAWLGRLQSLADAADTGHGWTPVSKLTVTQREQLDAAAGQTLELLAPIAVIFEVRRTQ